MNFREMSSLANLADLFRRAAGYVDKLLINVFFTKPGNRSAP